MKIVRIGLDQGPRYAVVDEEGNELILLADDPLFGGDKPIGQWPRSGNVRLASPTIPHPKVVDFDGSYPDGKPPASMDGLLVFLKPNTPVIGPDDPIVLPSHLPEVAYEVELAVVVGRVAKNVPPGQAHEAILGYTVAGDVIGVHMSLAIARRTDTFCSVSPYIETELDPFDLALVSQTDDELSREDRVSQLASSVLELVSYASRMFTLLSGDIMLTGPSGMRSINPQIASEQTVEAECEEIGRLRNPVIRR